MTDKECFEFLKQQIIAITTEECKEPKMPKGDIVVEAFELKRSASEDIAALQTVGITLLQIEELIIQAKAFRYAQKQWENKRALRIKQSKERIAKIQKAYPMRAQLIDDLHYALRNNPEDQTKIIKKGKNLHPKQVISDLEHLYELCKHYASQLQAISFSFSQLEYISNYTDTLRSILAVHHNEKFIVTEELVVRNKAYTFLKTRSDEIKSAAKYVFRGNKKKLKFYRSTYMRKMNTKYQS